MKRSIFMIAMLISFLPLTANAEWPVSGRLPFGSGDDLEPFMVSDGAGGVIAVGNNAGGAVIAQRVDRYGNLVWTNTVVASTTYGKYITGAVSDGAGGVIIAWSITGNDGYARRITADGQLMWGVNGTKLFNACCSGPVIVGDGTGGAAVFFQYASFIGFQYIGPTGALLYSLNGLQIANTWVDQFDPEMRAVSDAVGGYLVMWKFKDVSDSFDDWHAQHVNAQGGPLWGSGLVVNQYPSDKRQPDIAPDGSGGLIAVWADARNAPQDDVYGQHLTVNGTLAWVVDGLQLASGSAGQYQPRILREASGNTWLLTFRGFTYSGGYVPGIWAQRININGAFQWGSYARPLPFVAEYNVILDDSGGSLYCEKASAGLLAQRLDSSGAAVWPTEKVVMAQPASSLTDPGLVITDSQHMFVNGPGPEGRVQRVELVHGEAGRPEPGDVYAVDNPGDQGGKVLLQWSGSQLDVRPRTQITNYLIYRSPAGMNTWTLQGNQLARYASHYSLLIPNQVDDVAYDWRVRAATANANVYWESDIVTAASHDDLAPAAPTSLVASRASTGVSLSWAAGDDAVQYAVFRGWLPGFPVNEGSRIATSPVNTFVDDAAPAGEVFYAVAALDADGRMSAPSNEASAPAVSGGAAPVLTRLSLMANSPNPFVDATTLRVGVPHRQSVSIDVFDVSGRRVVSQQVSLDAGWNDVPFNGRRLANGVYFWRVRAGGETMTRKLVIQR